MNGHDPTFFNKDILLIGYCLSLYKYLKRMQQSVSNAVASYSPPGGESGDGIGV